MKAIKLPLEIRRRRVTVMGTTSDSRQKTSLLDAIRKTGGREPVEAGRHHPTAHRAYQVIRPAR